MKYYKMQRKLYSMQSLANQCKNKQNYCKENLIEIFITYT